MDECLQRGVVPEITEVAHGWPAVHSQVLDMPERTRCHSFERDRRELDSEVPGKKRLVWGRIVRHPLLFRSVGLRLGSRVAQTPGLQPDTDGADFAEWDAECVGAECVDAECVGAHCVDAECVDAECVDDDLKTADCLDMISVTAGCVRAAQHVQHAVRLDAAMLHARHSRALAHAAKALPALEAARVQHQAACGRPYFGLQRRSPP